MPDRSSEGPIAYLTGEYPRATDTFIQREVAGLRAQGVEVVTCSIRPTGPSEHVGAEQRAEHANTFQVLTAARRPLRLIGAHLWAVLARPLAYARTLALAWRTSAPGLRARLFQIFYFAEAVVLAQELRRRRVRHLHNHFANSSCTVAMLTSTLSGIPFSFTLHGPAIFFEPKRWRLDAKIARASFVSCISHFARSQAMLFCEPADWGKLHVIHCGVEPERYDRVRIPGQGRLLFVGRLAAVKGIPLLLEAVATLRTAYPGISLTLIGDGPERGALQELALRLNIADAVDFAGYRSQDEVADALTRADICVLPSFAEGVPVVLMEALASGVPVVATRVGGVAELVEDGVSGHLVPPGAVAGLISAIHDLLSDPEWARAMGAAGQAHVAKSFHAEREAARLAALFTGATRDLPSFPEPDAQQWQHGREVAAGQAPGFAEHPVEPFEPKPLDQDGRTALRAKEELERRPRTQRRTGGAWALRGSMTDGLGLGRTETDEGEAGGGAGGEPDAFGEGLGPGFGAGRGDKQVPVDLRPRGPQPGPNGFGGTDDADPVAGADDLREEQGGEVRPGDEREVDATPPRQHSDGTAVAEREASGLDPALVNIPPISADDMLHVRRDHVEEGSPGSALGETPERLLLRQRIEGQTEKPDPAGGQSVRHSSETLPVQLCVSIVNYRTPEMTVKCAESVLADLDGTDARVAIVDNGSGDGSADWIQGWIDGRGGPVTLVRSEANSGFSGGHNQAIENCLAENYLLLNSDAELRPGCLSALLAEMSKTPRTGIVTPRLEHPDGARQISHFRFFTPASELIRGAATGPVTRLLAGHQVPLERPDAGPIDWASFACVLLRREMLEDVGVLDPGYFLYFEDSAYCWQARARGWQIDHAPRARVVHHRGGSAPVKRLQRAKARLPAYYYASRTRFLYQAHGWHGLLAANLAWHAGRAIAWARLLTGRRVPAAATGEARDIWTNFFRPLGDSFAPGE